MRHTSWLNSLLSLNHLPPLPHAKKHMKLLSYLSMFLQNCLSFSTSTLFFDIFVQMENNTFESLLWHLKRKKKERKKATGCSEWSIRCIHHLQALSTKWGWICTHDAFLSSWSSSHLSSPFPLTHKTTRSHITEGNARSGLHASVCQQWNTFFAHYP